MDQQYPQESDSSINPPYPKRSDYPASKLIPMAPACSQVKTSNNIMSLSEELMSSPLDHPLQAEDIKERDEKLCQAPPDHIFLLDEVLVRGWLRLVKSTFNQSPIESCKKSRSQHCNSCKSEERQA